MGAGKHLQAGQVLLDASTVCLSPWDEGEDCGGQRDSYWHQVPLGSCYHTMVHQPHMIPVLLGGATKWTQVMRTGSWWSLLGTLICITHQEDGKRDDALFNALALDLVLGENLANPAACRAKPVSCTWVGSRGGSCLPQSCLAAAVLAVQPGSGESSAWRTASFSPQLVPPTAIWKYLPSRFGAKEQLAYTLLLRYPL